MSELLWEMCTIINFEQTVQHVALCSSSIVPTSVSVLLIAKSIMPYICVELTDAVDYRFQFTHRLIFLCCQELCNIRDTLGHY